MKDIVLQRPYEFVPPHRGTWWPSLIQRFDLYGIWLKRSEGVEGFELRHPERLRTSLDAGHGIMLTPNHCRYADPLVLGWLARHVGCHVYGMASWHLFNQDRFTGWAIRMMGGFSVNREGVDRQAINTAITVLETAERPLIVFPEGAVSRTNDRLHAMLDGVSFIARAGARKRAQNVPGGQVVVHPVAIKYRFHGDLEAVADEVLSEIEERFSWRPQRNLALLDRVIKVGRALLCLKEVEYFDKEQAGPVDDRLRGLIDRLLHPVEEEWLGERRGGAVVPRVKALRMKLLPDMIHERVDAAERERRWLQLSDMYLAQQVSCYPPDYLISRPSVDRLLETLERFEEDLTDRVRVHGSLTSIIEVGEAIPVDIRRDRSAGGDPLMNKIETELQQMLDRLAAESPLYQPSRAEEIPAAKSGEPAQAALAANAQQAGGQPG